jgi:hypothetical protein
MHALIALLVRCAYDERKDKESNMVLAPVTEGALIQRVNRKLIKKYEAVRKVAAAMHNRILANTISWTPSITELLYMGLKGLILLTLPGSWECWHYMKTWKGKADVHLPLTEPKQPLYL